MSASTVSYHVKLLKSVGLVAVRKHGRNCFYTARGDALDHLQDLVTELTATCRENGAALTDAPRHSA